MTGIELLLFRILFEHFGYCLINFRELRLPGILRAIFLRFLNGLPDNFIGFGSISVRDNQAHYVFIESNFEKFRGPLSPTIPDVLKDGDVSSCILALSQYPCVTKESGHKVDRNVCTGNATSNGSAEERKYTYQYCPGTWFHDVVFT